MKRVTKKVLAGLFAISLTLPQLTGCGTKSGEDYSKQTLTVQVQELNGTKVTAQIGTLSEFKHDGDKSGDTPSSDMPQKSDGDGSGGTPPSGMPQRSDDNGSGGTPPSGMPQRPDNGEASGGAMQAPSGDAVQFPSGFTAGDETVTFTLSDDISVKIESMNGEEDGTISDIAEGSVLEVTYDSKNQVSSIVIKNTMNGGGNKKANNGSNQT